MLAIRRRAAARIGSDQPGYLLRIARRAHTLIFAKHMIEDLTMPQFSTLVKLRDVGLVSQNNLGRLIYSDSATMRGVSGLLARELIEIESILRISGTARSCLRKRGIKLSNG
jgi:hypothetical protein